MITLGAIGLCLLILIVPINSLAFLLMFRNNPHKGSMFAMLHLMAGAGVRLIFGEFSLDINLHSLFGIGSPDTSKIEAKVGSADWIGVAMLAAALAVYFIASRAFQRDVELSRYGGAWRRAPFYLTAGKVKPDGFWDGIWQRLRYLFSGS